MELDAECSNHLNNQPHISNLIVAGIILFIISIFIFMSLINLTNNIYSFIIVDLFVYFFSGYLYGKNKTEYSRLFYLVLPFFVFALGLLMLGNIGDAPIYTIIFFSVGIINFIVVCTGSYIGVKKSSREEMKTSGSKWKNFAENIFLKLKNVKPGIIAVVIMIFLLFLWHIFFITELIKSSLFFNVFFYLLFGFFFGRTWPKYSWKWGIILVVPWFIISIYNFISHKLFIEVFNILMLLGLLYLILSCIGAYFGATKRGSELSGAH